MKDQYFAKCITDHSCAVCGNATDSCKCAQGCQDCFNDVYNACGGCSNKDGYDFDKTVAPVVKKQAESMGCSGAGANTVAASAFLAVVAMTALLF